jgi:hypothetical protein
MHVHEGAERQALGSGTQCPNGPELLAKLSWQNSVAALHVPPSAHAKAPSVGARMPSTTDASLSGVPPSMEVAVAPLQARAAKTDPAQSAPTRSDTPRIMPRCRLVTMEKACAATEDGERPSVPPPCTATERASFDDAAPGERTGTAAQHGAQAPPLPQDRGRHSSRAARGEPHPQAAHVARPARDGDHLDGDPGRRSAEDQSSVLATRRSARPRGTSGKQKRCGKASARCSLSSSSARGLRLGFRFRHRPSHKTP